MEHRSGDGRTTPPLAGSDRAAPVGDVQRCCWLRILKADPAALFTMASKAQAATDYLTTTAGLDTDHNEGE